MLDSINVRVQVDENKIIKMVDRVGMKLVVQNVKDVDDIVDSSE